jgi:hypothetical protein
VPIESEHERAERLARVVTAIAAAVAVGAIAFALLARYRPELARQLIPIGQPAVAGQPERAEESAALAGSAGSVIASDTHTAVTPAPPDTAADSARQKTDTAVSSLFALLQDTSSRGRARRPIITDVVLLPCSSANPQPDGSVVIPPHNPRHRTIVGLPQKPGEPPRGFVIPPHNPNVENQVPIKIIPMDSLLAHTLRVPPHDPSAFSVVRPDSMSCLPDSGAASERQ